MRKIYSSLIITGLLIASCAEKTPNKAINIIPKPKEIQQAKGVFSFDENTKIYITNKLQSPVARLLQQQFQKATELPLEFTETPKNKNIILFENEQNLGKEGYILDITEDKISLKASHYSGFVYAWESLRQLLPNTIESKQKVKAKWNVPALMIKDNPRFAWRGLMLDVSRHFFPKEYVLQTLDRLALLKMNTLHLHLVDDQGWRIEIKKYPKLTEVGAWRVDREQDHWNAREAQKKGEKATYGGFYTQEDIKEIVAYAAKLGIDVVPEIEMPAHVTCAIAAYPELSCQGKKVSVPPGGVWPITDIYCAGNEKVFAFLEDILSEILPLFPSKYVHIGGDEATKTNWVKCRKCKARMHKEKLKNVEELQSYFIKRMEQFISTKVKVLIGWDEILEGGLAPGAIVMSWRGVKGGLEASAQGHDVVMTPGTHCYFDHYQGVPDNEPLAIGGYTTLSKVYEFDPVVDTMSIAQARHVLGGQANLWAEYIPTPKHSEYMLFPRLAALSETLWLPKKLRNKDDFFHRILPFMNRLEVMGVNYAKSSFDVTYKATLQANGAIECTLESEFPNTEIHYSLNDENITAKSPVYTSSIQLEKTTTVRAVAVKDGKIIGKTLQKTFNFHKAKQGKVNYENKYDKRYQGEKEQGLVNVLRGSLNFYDGHWQGWQNTPANFTVELPKPSKIKQVTIGSMENQGSHIFFPAQITVSISKDGKAFKSVGKITRPYQKNGYNILQDFTIKFEEQEAKYIKIMATNLNATPFPNDTWLFIDEVVVE